MKKKEINKKKLIIDLEKQYEDDYKLMQVMSQTKEVRHNTTSLTKSTNTLKNLMIKIHDEQEQRNNKTGKALHLSNEAFKNEYNMFNKRKNKKDTKTVFKELVKLYKLKGYRIPNFSINEHNLFKINPLLEANTEAISNGFIANQILKKNNASEKTVNYLKKLGGLLSEKLTNENIKNDFKKINIAKFKNINEEDSVEELKKQIEILLNLINTNALDKLDEPKKTFYKSNSRQNSFRSYKYKSSKKLISLTNKKYTISRRNSPMSNKKVNKFYERKMSTESSVTSGSYYHKKKSQNRKISQKISNILNFNINIPGEKSTKTPKDIKIPILNLNKINKKNDENILELSSRNNNNITPKKIKFSSEKINNIFINELKSLKTPRKNKITWTRKTIKEMEENLLPIPSNGRHRHLSTVKNFFNNDSSISDEYNISTSKRKSIYPYTSRNEFIDYTYNKLTKKGFDNCENYVKTYLNKVKGFNDEKINNFFKSIYERNIKNNLDDLENKITENDIYYKTERLYLSNHLIKRIFPTLKSMNEKDKLILKLEKNLAHSIIVK
jgi:hypothetical protein